MPSFKCEECGEKFSSRRKKETHYRKEHGDDKGVLPGGENSLLSSRKLGAALVIVLMVGLPLGGGMFYSSLSPSQGEANYSYDYNPPVGYGAIPEEGNVPGTAVLSEPLSKPNQVFLLARGGTVDVGQGLKPSVILQYSCTDCPEIRYGLEKVAREFNQNERFVYVAPNPSMEHRVTVSGLRNLTTFENMTTQKVKQAICGKISLPVQCVESEFNFRTDESSNSSNSPVGSENAPNNTTEQSSNTTENVTSQEPEENESNTTD